MGTMDAATTQQLATAIQALAASVAALPPPPAPPAPAAPAADPLTSPYEGGPLDLASRHGSSLFHDGAQALTSKFTGKVNALQLFLADLKTRAKTCRWDHPTHGILMVVSCSWLQLQPTQRLWKNYRPLSRSCSGSPQCRGCQPSS